MVKQSELTNLGQKLSIWFTELERDRREKEVEWAESLRQYRGEYDPEELQRIKANGGSEVYPKVTRYKVLTALAKINEILFPDIDKNWAIEPSPIPTVPKSVLVKIIQGLIKTDEQGQPLKPSDEEVQVAIYDYVLNCCRQMEAVIEDDLNEMNYLEIARKVVFSGLLFGTGVMKGVISKPVTNYQWAATENKYELESEVIYRPYIEFVPIWDFYPDSTVADIKDCEGVFQRHILSKHDVRGLTKRSDFDAQQLQKLLKQYPNGDSTYKAWEIDIFANDRALPRQNKYEFLEFWGYVDGMMLKECGVDVPEKLENAEVEANIWIAGKEVVKAVVNPLATKRRPYHVFYYEKDETSIFGTGLPRVGRDSQISIAAATRMLLDNAAIVSGPQTEINVELLLQNNQDTTKIHPRKIWYREGKGHEAQYPAIRSIEFNSHIAELLQIIQVFKQFLDEETTVYSFFGEPTQTNSTTARGTSMRMSLVNMTLKDIVRNFDAVNMDFIKAMYEWNMQFNPRDDIKGDFEVLVRGSANLVAKEVLMESLNLFAQTLSPEERLFVKEYEFLRERMKAHGLPYKELLRTQEAAEMLAQSQQDQELMELQKTMLKADIDYQNAKSLHMLAKSKKQQINIDQDRASGELLADTEVKLKQAKALKDLFEARLKKKTAELEHGEE